MLRKPAVAGQFYPAQKGSLEQQLKGLIKENKDKIEAKAIVLPHAGYVYSGGVAGAVVGKLKSCSTYVIIGPNHTGSGKTFSIMTEGSWQTPLGDVEVDQALAQALIEDSDLLEQDSSAHSYEHSIEVELPFLQYLNPDFKFVPIVLGVSDLESYKKLGQEIASAIKRTNTKDFMIIASSDMTHYESQEDARRKDHLAIKTILKQDPDSLWDVVKREEISMCGYAPCITMLSAAKILGASKAELVLYQTSGDVTGDKSSVVGYAGIIIN